MPIEVTYEGNMMSRSVSYSLEEAVNPSNTQTNDDDNDNKAIIIPIFLGIARCWMACLATSCRTQYQAFLCRHSRGMRASFHPLDHPRKK
eukprot:scaffold48715_cov49-Attheya_sp.AAC.2